MTEILPGIVIVEGRRCPKCGGALFRKPCPCPFKRRGFATCARCLNPKCATVVGLETRKDRGRRRSRQPKSPLGPFGITP